MPGVPAHDWTELDPALPERMVAAAAASLSLRQRAPFFVWARTQMQTLLPHQLLVCALESDGAWQADVFNSLPLPTGLAERLLGLRGAGWQELQRRWRHEPLSLDCSELPDELGQGLSRAGYAQLLLHGAPAPGRAQRAEAWFLWASTAAVYTRQQRQLAAWLMPHLHAAWRQVQAAAQPGPGMAPAPSTITAREQQILALLCLGLSNQAIALRLELSALTVKNHVQKLLRKLGASNRAQAAAMATSLRLVPLSA